MILLALTLAAASIATPDLSQINLIDLTHAFDEKTLYWPTSPSGFKLQVLHKGKTSGGWFYSANAFCAPEHGGTHLDAPFHFAANGDTAADIPLSKLIAPAAVIDVSAKAAIDADYRLTVSDVNAYEKSHGSIPAGTIVLLRTGWDQRYSDRKAYFGDATPGSTSKLHFPSFSAEAVRFLIEERKVVAIGVDTASIDYGPATDFPVHRLVGAHNIPAFENLTNLDQLPAAGAFMIALPMKIANGTGGPLRAVAFVPR